MYNHLYFALWKFVIKCDVSLQMLQVLISKGGNVNAMDKKDRRPIHWAAFMGEK